MSSKRGVRYRESVTPDGRDLTGAKWRTIPEFPKYEITKDGDVRHRETWTLLQEIENKRTGVFYYSLWKDRTDGTSSPKNRTYLGLLYSAWPELLEAWKPIPEYPMYRINRQKEVMSTRLWRVIKSDSRGQYQFCINRKRFFWYPAMMGDEQAWEEFWADPKGGS